ncbi:MAG: hypothetical protein JNM18_20370 [Planctomycetaceae bacterium]|nr:hypothetical protein [Planctomycetaceae bacterium]
MTTCQVGAEAALKHELAIRWPEFRFSYSRPGFLTFKLPPDAEIRDDFELGAVFARWYGFNFGKATGTDEATRLAAVATMVGDRQFDQLHIFPRDRYAPGDHRYEPGLTHESDMVDAALRAQLGDHITHEASPSAEEGQLVLDVVLVGPEEWWGGWHRARSRVSRWPGGLRRLETPVGMVSRAYLKLMEGLEWSRLPLKPGQVCAEIGCAPGGACQALLEVGMHVIGIDPAEVDSKVAAHPNFVHIRKRGHEVRRGEFHAVRWLFADLNVAPSYTLDTIEEIVTHPTVHIRGMIVTLKLLEWSLADELPAYLERIRSWGFTSVRARQLQHNRQEVCVVAEKPG